MIHNSPVVQEKIDALLDWFSPLDSALVAYSGGVDSALVMTLAHRQLGNRAVACIGVSPSYPVREMHQAVKLAQDLGVVFRLVETDEHLDEDYAANPRNRCYFCKSTLYQHLRRIADAENFALIVDGSNQSDLGDDRPGMTAAAESGVRSPLIELGVTKDEVRGMAKRLDLPVWDKPAMACLSSRVPHGTPITPHLLRQIEAAEDVLVEQGFRQFRVRHHGQVARIELPIQDFSVALVQREALVEGIRNVGYQFVCLDLAGFRSGTDGVDTAHHVVPLTVERKA